MEIPSRKLEPVSARKREPLPGTWRPGSPVTFTEDGPFPFDYASDLHWLWGWGARIDSLLSKGIPQSGYEPSRYDWIIFRPDAFARDAMMRFSIKYPHVVKQMDDYLDFLEKQWTEFSDDGYDGTSTSAENFVHNMGTLAERIRVACETIANAEASELDTDELEDADDAHLPETTETGWADKAIESRNKWIYDRVMEGVAWQTIVNRLQSQSSDWEPIGSISGIKRAANAYAQRHNKPSPPIRQPGRR